MIKDEVHHEKIFKAILDCAERDHQEGIMMWATGMNDGKSLERRLNLQQYRRSPRKGDPHKYRTLYQAARFLIATDED